MRYRLSFTLDYEIHGNGDGNPKNLMVEPTDRLMNLLERYGQKLIIMADVAEILAFKRYFSSTGYDLFCVSDIEHQLQDAIRRGHDVQLHIHSSWFNANWNGRRWDQCIEEYNLASLPIERIDEMVNQCISYLRELLTPIKSDYTVWLFRAANWSMMPTWNITQVLLKHGVIADTSVYKGGVQGGNVSYDYRDAYHSLLSYPADAHNINHLAPITQSRAIVEYPIYTEMKPFWSFLTPMRIIRMVRARFHQHKKRVILKDPSINEINKADNKTFGLRAFFRRSPWKMDYNQATGRQLINAMKRITKTSTDCREIVDVVLIGHSKSFLRLNEPTIERFLKWAESNPQIIKQ